MPNDDYIKRSEVLQIECDLCNAMYCKRDYQCIKGIRLNNLPAADVEPKMRWIPVTDRLPERGTEVLTAIFGTDLIVQEDGESLEDAVRRARSGPGRVEMGYLDDDGIWTEILFGAPMMVLPRYWMPLPEPPKEEDDDN